MEKKILRFLNPDNTIQIILLLAFCGVTARFNTVAGLIQLAVALLYILYIINLRFRMTRAIKSYLGLITRELDNATRESFINFPLPVTILHSDGTIIWYNERYTSVSDGEGELFGANISTLIPSVDLNIFKQKEFIDINIEHKKYSLFGSYITSEDMYILYWLDNTELKNIYDKYFATRSVIGYITIDNYEEFIQNANEEERSSVSSEIEVKLLNKIRSLNGLLKQIDKDRYFLLLDEENLKTLRENKFDILDEIRAINLSSKINATLSIGLGSSGEGFVQNEEMARQALDMALGRGGDQAVIKNLNSYDFFGGRSRGVEKRTKVRSRIIATALTALADDAENILIMGHRYTDLDSLGACSGVAAIARSRNKKVNIILDNKSSMAVPLFENLVNNIPLYDNIFLNPEDALDFINTRTLLVIVDTHRIDYLDSPDIYRNCQKIVIIDHHRKVTDHIKNATLFYHEPYASSTSEMVAEMLQYTPNAELFKEEAEALLAGITLDTKNFTVKAGVRTFEASAYLRRSGADLLEIKKFFRKDFRAYREVTAFMSKAEMLFGNIALVVWEEGIFDGIRIIAAQAADELLNVLEIDASFVIYKSTDAVNISARSLDSINVQRVLEKLGGGGHFTMAGAQLRNTTVTSTRDALIQAIKDVIGADES